MLFRFDSKKLNKIAEDNANKYQSASPFPHIYLDNFLPNEVAESLLKAFPLSDDPAWGHSYNDENQKKLASEDQESFPEVIRYMLQEFNSSTFVEFLEKLTGIDGLVPDPHYRGGGMHQILPGGFLKVHVDFNWYKRLRLERRLNVILFLNKDWKEEYGGHFELWNKDMIKADVKVLPIFNRVAIFSTSEESFHGHPDPLACPPGMTRKSLALYYYTSPAVSLEAEAAAHSTVFKARPEDKPIFVKKVIRQIVPPIILSVVKKMKF